MEKIKTVLLTSSQPVYTVLSGEIVNFIFDPKIPEATIIINGIGIKVKNDAGNFKVSAPSGSFVFSQINDIFQTSAASLDFQIIYKGQENTFVMEDEKWEFGRYDARPGKPLTDVPPSPPPSWDILKF